MKELIHFTADWCQPCKAMLPVIAQFKDKHPNINYIKIDIDKNQDVAKAYSVKGVPTFISIVDNQQFQRKTGRSSLSQLESLFE